MSTNWLRVEHGTPEGIQAVLQEFNGVRNCMYIEYGENGQSYGPLSAKEGFLSFREHGEACIPTLLLKPTAREGDDLKTIRIVAIRQVTGEVLWKHPEYRPAYDWTVQRVVPNGREHRLFMKPHFPSAVNQRGETLVVEKGTASQISRWIKKYEKLDC